MEGFKSSADGKWFKANLHVELTLTGFLIVEVKHHYLIALSQLLINVPKEVTLGFLSQVSLKILY